MLYMRKMRHRAYTMIELLVVISVMAIMAAIVLPNWHYNYLHTIMFTSANELAEDIRYCRLMGLEAERQSIFMYSSYKQIAECYLENPDLRNVTGSSSGGNGQSWGYTTNKVTMKTTKLDSAVHLSADRNGSSVPNQVSLQFREGGNPTLSSGFVTEGNDYVIYVACTGISSSIPVRCSKRGGRVTVG